MSLRNCSICATPKVTGSAYCPHCLSIEIEAKINWFPVTTEGSDNPTLNHELVPEHRLLPESRAERMLSEYDVDRTDLPLIQKSDPALEHLGSQAGDIIEIVRDSRTADTARVYRLVVSEGNSQTPSTRDSNKWRNPESPAEGTYRQAESLSEEQALHVLENLRAHIPPSRPGTPDSIAVDRESELQEAVDRVGESIPYTFVQGELGHGKSFFIQWVRDRVYPNAAVSFVDLDNYVKFTNEKALINSLRTNIKTPRSEVNEQYANGLDELWDTFLRQMADLCAGSLEGRGYQLQERWVASGLGKATLEVLREHGVSSELAENLSNLAEDYFDISVRSLSQHIEQDGIPGPPNATVDLISSLAEIGGYRVLICVDELEKSERTADHFKEIETFIEQLPSNVSLFVTGTPELVSGGQDENTMRETHELLYDRTIENRIALGEPSEDDLVALAEQLKIVEEAAGLQPSQREYTTAIDSKGGPEAAVSAFLSDAPPSFRAFLTFVEDHN